MFDCHGPSRLLYGPRKNTRFLQRVVRTRVIDDLFAQQAIEERHRLLEPRDARRGRVVGQAHLPVIGNAPAGTDADLDAPSREHVHRRDLFGERDQIPVIHGENEGADADALSRVRGGHHRGDRRELRAHVIGDEEHVIALRLGAPREFAPASPTSGPSRGHREAKRARHVSSLVTGRSLAAHTPMRVKRCDSRVTGV